MVQATPQSFLCDSCHDRVVRSCPYCSRLPGGRYMWSYRLSKMQRAYRHRAGQRNRGWSGSRPLQNSFHKSYALVLPDCRTSACTLAKHQRQPTRLLAHWQIAALVTPSRAGWVAFPARYARIAGFGVRQHGCRNSRAHDPARGTPLTLLVAGMLDVLVTIIESVRNESLLVDVF